MKYMVSFAVCVLCLTGASFAQSRNLTLSPARIAARERFGALGLQYSKESFLKQASEGDAIGVKAFLDAGMDLNLTDKDGDTALTLATKAGSLDTVQVLVKGGANVDKTGQYGWNPLRFAASANYPAIVRYLLDNGATVNARGPSGQSALIAGADHPAVVDILLSYGADVDADNGVALVLASRSVPKATFESMLKKAKISHKLLNELVIRAAYNADPGVIEALLQRGADVNARDYMAATPLINAAGNRNPAVAELLLAHGAEVNVQDKNGSTPILMATNSGNVNVVRELLEHGADLSLGANRKIVSAPIEKGNLSVLQLLLDHHAYLGPPANAYEQPPLVKALQWNRLAIFQAILKSGLDTADDKSKMLFAAAQANQVDFVEALLDNGANVNAALSNGFSVLMQAAKDGDYNMVKLLLARGANVNAKTDKNETAQTWAEQANQSELAKLLADSAAKK